MGKPVRKAVLTLAAVKRLVIGEPWFWDRLTDRPTASQQSASHNTKEEAMRIGVLGTGTVGHTLGSKLVELGHRVNMGSREGIAF
jgi:hypothetical protein